MKLDREPIYRALRARAEARLALPAPTNPLVKVGHFLRCEGISDVYLAGGALLRGTPKDLDFWRTPGYPTAWSAPADQHVLTHGHAPGTVVQLCDADVAPLALRDLCESFDFAHCQVGVRLEYDGVGLLRWTATEVYASDAYIQALASGTTWFVPPGRDPGRSLARAPMQAAKLGLDRAETVALIKSIVPYVAGVTVENLEDSSVRRRTVPTFDIRDIEEVAQ